MNGDNYYSTSAEHQGLSEGNERNAAARGSFQSLKNARDEWKAREPLPRGRGGRGASRGNTNMTTSGGKTGGRGNDGGTVGNELQGITNRYNLRSSVGENNVQSPEYRPVEGDRQTSHALPYAPMRIPEESLRSHGSPNPPHRTFATKNQRQEVVQQESKLGRNSTTRRRNSPSTFRFSPDHPVPSVEKSDEGPTGPRSGLEVLMNPRYRSPHFEKYRSPRAGTVSPPPAPCATDVYLAQAKLPCVRLKSPQRLLLVLDLNGTLIARQTRSQPSLFDRRPGLDKFFSYIFTHHSVMIYTSSQPWTVSVVLPKLFTESQREQLVAVWNRNYLDLTPEQYREKVQVYKRLQKVWGDQEVQAKYLEESKGKESGSAWNQMNTVLIDDSELKALAQPHNLLQVPEFPKHCPKKDLPAHERALDEVILKLEQLKWQTDVSRLIRLWQTGKVEVPQVREESATAEADEEEDGGVALTTAGIRNMSVGQETTREMSVGQQSGFSAGQSREMSVGQEKEVDAERPSERERDVSVGQ
ncbi:MAG: hypothetical protein Q9160_002447 [Pyrenula sp. 1 TL-2023]